MIKQWSGQVWAVLTYSVFGVNLKLNSISFSFQIDNSRTTFNLEKKKHSFLKEQKRHEALFDYEIFLLS